MTPLNLFLLLVSCILGLLVAQTIYYSVRIVMKSRGRCIFIMNEHIDALGKKMIADCILCERKFIIWKWEEIKDEMS